MFVRFNWDTLQGKCNSGLASFDLPSETALRYSFGDKYSPLHSSKWALPKASMQKAKTLPRKFKDSSSKIKCHLELWLSFQCTGWPLLHINFLPQSPLLISTSCTWCLAFPPNTLSLIYKSVRRRQVGMETCVQERVCSRRLELKSGHPVSCTTLSSSPHECLSPSRRSRLHGNVELHLGLIALLGSQH